ncbi:C4-dicarboxylate ABC transporter substrate-binding protein [Oceaniferula spumae]|uniref:C4-dicarboxylate ABC transporter substrate-binding protein n=1 Tax=Oceaniferula spumae TaxID=2979115 RepID=A0AAT9FM78_9BACT
MKKANILVGVLIGALAASALFAYLGRKQLSGEGGSGVSQERVIKVAHNLPNSHPVHQGIEHFARRLEALSGGRMKCDVFPNGQLGDETEYLEKLQAGSLDIAKTSAAPIANFVPRMKVFSLPYLFRDRDHYWSVLDGKIGTHLLEELETRDGEHPSGIRGLCYYDAGSRNFYSVGEIKDPADLKGLNIRVMKDPIAIAMTSTLGANPVPMPGGEIYSALQRGNINGAENNPPTFVAQRHYEVCKNFIFDHHSRIPDVLNISSALWKTLTDQEREWVLTAARESSHFQRKLWQAQSDAAVEEMKKNGVTIREADISAFQKAAGPSRKDFLTGEVKTYAEQIESAQ